MVYINSSSSAMSPRPNWAVPGRSVTDRLADKFSDVKQTLLDQPRPPPTALALRQARHRPSITSSPGSRLLWMQASNCAQPACKLTLLRRADRQSCSGCSSLGAAARALMLRVAAAGLMQSSSHDVTIDFGRACRARMRRTRSRRWAWPPLR